jgi:hypothetical protein
MSQQYNKVQKTKRRLNRVKRLRDRQKTNQALKKSKSEEAAAS